ncbi:UCH-domain-containing protein [Piedraia hortae CBS 480.64]|uniref:ubiquitinyl hydrolase 1 n=1 Tax=Piedraia hortae CBS 480.64 TaxID=1314780 RepID=A0A6A7C4K9_9PEZI|nr:UCH-domain-containing protein [Piedraia hortae CBS 480.64]
MDAVQAEVLEESALRFVISSKWLDRVLARTSDYQADHHTKEMREGPIGPVDNSDIVSPMGYATGLRDAVGLPYVPLRPGLIKGVDYEVLPSMAWSKIIKWYNPGPQYPDIIRYTHNTAEPPQQNLEDEIYPPVFVVCRVTQTDDVEPPPTILHIEKFGFNADPRGRGQASPEDSLVIVSSRQEVFQDFLARVKKYAGIPLSTKVKVWRLLNGGNASNGEQRAENNDSSGIDTSKLNIPPSKFMQLEVGTHIEALNVTDQTNNPNYNGRSNMDLFGLCRDDTLLLEEQVRDSVGTEFMSDSKAPKFASANAKAASAPTSRRTSPGPGAMLTRGRTRKDERTRGTVGLNNLGNTCYMNSALQCIRSVEELAVYFLSNQFKNDVNPGNPLGHGGSMAKQYAGLLEQIYGSNAGGSVSPTSFKKTLGGCQPLFSGYGQQDSQEFLSFLVDALHEDLNRIIKKPYNENPDSDDSTVHDPKAIIELGEVYRSNHRARNDSIAMDLFNGFYKNTMECPVCDKISVTFDPYSLLTLQLPTESAFQHDIIYVPFEGKPVVHEVDMDRSSTVGMLKQDLAAKNGDISPERLWMIEVYTHGIYRVFDNQAQLSEVQKSDHIFMFELQYAPTFLPLPTQKSLYTTYSRNSANNEIPSMDSPRADCFTVPVYPRKPGRYTSSSSQLTMHPFYITVTRDEARDLELILKKLVWAVSQQTSRPILSEFAAVTREEGERSEAMMDDDARVSDKSNPSEEDYVDVQLRRATEDGGAAAKFFNSPRSLPEDLVSTMFTVNVAKPPSNTSAFFSGGSNIDESSIRPLASRVHQSRQSTATSSESPVDSDVDEDDKADSGVDDDKADSGGEDAPDAIDPLWIPDPEEITSRAGRRKQKAKGKKSKRFLDFAKKRPKVSRQPRRGSNASEPQRSSKASDNDDGEYYIKAGEAIVLDYTNEAINAMFGKRHVDDGDVRGSWLSSTDGQGLERIVDPKYRTRRARREERRKHGITLEDCFAETGKREILSEDNAWYCNRCKERRQAAKTLDIWTLPDILIVHLKRFGGNRSFRDKIETMVKYPVWGLDLNGKVGLKEDNKDYVYDLFAVDSHFGGLSGGHYTASAKNFYDGEWYAYNDSFVSKTNECAVLTKSAYLLFYRRRSANPLGPAYLQDLVLQSRASYSNEDAPDSGEDRLGEPTTFSPRGSSSNCGAEVGEVEQTEDKSAEVMSTLEEEVVNDDYDEDELHGSIRLPKSSRKDMFVEDDEEWLPNDDDSGTNVSEPEVDDLLE